MKAEIIILLLTGAIFLGCTTMVTRGLRNESEHKLITNETEAIAHNKLVFLKSKASKTTEKRSTLCVRPNA